MKRYTKITPEGTKDFLFAECSAMDDVCGKVEKVFRTQSNFMTYSRFPAAELCRRLCSKP